jgi:Flp pilus assembly protein TadD
MAQQNKNSNQPEGFGGFDDLISEPPEDVVVPSPKVTPTNPVPASLPPSQAKPVTPAPPPALPRTDPPKPSSPPAQAPAKPEVWMIVEPKPVPSSLPNGENNDSRKAILWIFVIFFFIFLLSLFSSADKDQISSKNSSSMTNQSNPVVSPSTITTRLEPTYSNPAIDNINQHQKNQRLAEQEVERVVSYAAASSNVQRMLIQSLKNDDEGFNSTRQQLDEIPKPAHQNVKKARILNQQGLDMLKRNDYSAAATTLQKAQELDPADIEIAGNLGYTYLKLGQLNLADQYLIYAISLAPGRSSSWFNLGQVYGSLDNFEKATGAFAAAYRTSRNQSKTADFIRQALTLPENNETTRAALKRTLELFGLPLTGVWD